MYLKAFDKLIFEILGDEKTILEKLYYYSEPYFENVTETDCRRYKNINIELIEIKILKSNSVLYENIEKKDSKVLGYSYWEKRNNHFIFFDHYSSSSYFEMIENKKKIIFYYSDKACAAYDLFRLMRNIAVKKLSKAGILVHGSCFVKNDGGVLVIGDKFAGKTTLMLSAVCKYKDVSFVTNDVGYYNVTSGKYYGIPKAISIRQITIDKMNLALNSTYQYNYRKNVQKDWKTKVKISTKEFSDQLSVQLRAITDIRIIIYLEYNEKDSIKRVVNENEKYQLFKQQVLNVKELDVHEMEVKLRPHLGKFDFWKVSMNQNTQDICLSYIQKVIFESKKTESI